MPSYHDTYGLRISTPNLGTVVSEVIVVHIIIIRVTIMKPPRAAVMFRCSRTVMITLPLPLPLRPIFVCGGGSEIGDGMSNELRRGVGGFQSFSR